MVPAVQRRRPQVCGRLHGMTTPEPETPQPRDIALEQKTPEQAADLEAQSEVKDSAEVS
jgi:hypothetical protein